MTVNRIESSVHPEEKSDNVHVFWHTERQCRVVQKASYIEDVV